MSRSLSILFMAVFVCWGAGCVHREIIEGRPGQSETTLIVVSGTGGYVVGWQSEVGKLYSVVRSDSLGGGSRWEVVEGGGSLRGTGEYMSFTDTVHQASDRGYYRLQIHALTPSSKPRK